MSFFIDAACGCHTGMVRKTNEDNFFFCGNCLEMNHNGTEKTLSFQQKLHKKLFLAVFDGMGGEYFGEMASYAAAKHLRQAEQTPQRFLESEIQYLDRLIQGMNDAVVVVQREMRTEHMGSTMVGLQFSRGYVCACNVGDSRAYLFRDGMLLQLSEDHVEKRPGFKSSPLTQYLGLNPEEFRLEACIGRLRIRKGDLYLLCSDGLTDMLTNSEINDIMLRSANPEQCVQDLIRSALEHGGRDNITAIICRIN